MNKKKKKICMIVQDRLVKGGIAAVISGYYGSSLEKDFNIKYLESYRDGNKVQKLLKGLGAYFKFLKVLLLDKPDIVHIHSSFGPSFYRKIPFIYMAKIKKIPIINHIHGADFDEFYLNAGIWKKKLIKKIYNQCDAFIALSRKWKENLNMIVPNKEIYVIENYSIINEKAISERKKRKCNNKVLFLGEIGHRKGCYDIPDVVEKVVKEIPNVKFIIGGSGEIENIKEILLKKGVIKNVIFPGWVRDEEKNRLLSESDVFFLPSYNEGMPMSILDAMGYGLPIVSTCVGGISNIVKDGFNGYIYKPGSCSEFSTALIEILKDNSKRIEFGNNSYNLVKERYSLKRHISLIENLYIKLLS